MSNGFLKSMVGSWSLERKCLLFLGLALLASLLLAFYAVQLLASDLVMETARRSARDYANDALNWIHMKQEFDPMDAQPSLETTNRIKMLELLEARMESRFEYEILRVEDLLEHDSLKGKLATGRELKQIYYIQSKLAELDSIAAEEKLAKEKAEAASKPSASESEGPVPVTGAAVSPAGKKLKTTPYAFAEDRLNDSYFYYHPIAFEKYCFDCHTESEASKKVPTSPSLNPFRVMKVKVPYSETAVWSMWTYSALTSIAICTLALSLFFIHWVLKRLVIRPLSYMKHISEEITRGDTKLRFNVDTEDEFHELSESFNRMLRHMTEAQEQLQAVNLEKDQRVDELARVNLQLFEANRLKGEFLANMSHELRTPLNSILGFSEVLQGFESLTDKQRRYASNIQSSGRLLLDMINDILDLAKVEAGKMEVRPSEFCILSVIHAQCELVRKMAEDKNIDLRVDSSQSEMRIRQDQGKVQQILTNLLSNAIKFTPEGGLVTVYCEWQNQDEVLLSVSDTGVGVAPGDYEIIFEKFRQAKGVTGQDGLTREHSGTGLGLSIVRELCRLLGGDISLTSQLGCGSTFRVVLPRVYREVAPASGMNGGLSQSM